MVTSVPGLNLLAMMPCPLKVPVEQQVSEKIQSMMNEDKDKLFSYQIVSNAVKQENVFLNVAQAKTIEDLPDIMIAPGFSRFFYPEFADKFRLTGCFESVCTYPPSELYADLQIPDPEGYYDITAFNPLIFLVDKTNHPDLPTPKKWEDLLNPCYENLISYRGHNDRAFCEGVLLTVFKEYGYDGIAALARTIKSRLHPAEMARLAGSGKEEAPAISVIPAFFANTARKSKNVTAVWPEDGAIANPLVMLVKKDVPEEVRELGRYLAGKEIGETMHSAGYYSVFPDLHSPDFLGHKYNWLGWDFLFSHNLSALMAELNEKIYNIYRR